MSGRRGAWLRGIVGVVAVSMILVTAVAVAGAVAGYRPVVIQTGSMGDYSPAGSLIIAAPREADAVAVGDVVIMQRPGVATVTHRVIEVEQQGAARFAITKGDANEAPDPTPYPLDQEQLVSRWVFPGWGFRVQNLFAPSVALLVMSLAIFVVAARTLIGIWQPDEEEDVDDEASKDLDSTTDESGAFAAPGRRLRRRVFFASIPLSTLVTGGVAWAMFIGSASVGANTFASGECFDAQLGSVQNGETVHAIDGPINVGITAVDPTRSFVMLTTRSAANEPADATLTGRLTGGGTTLELARSTDAGVPPLIVVRWSVVEYPCGVSVQRGTVVGDGTNVLDVPVAAADPASSFVLVSTATEPSAATFDGDDLFIAELTVPENLRIEAAAGSVLSPQRTFAWQIVTFTDPGDVSVQTASTTLASGDLSGVISLASPADQATTFLITGATSPSTGADIGERMVRTHLSSATTVAVDRLVGGDPIAVQVQVVTLREGSTVRHGTVDFTAATPVQTVTIDAVDPSRSTAISTVAIPGANSGGSTDMVADDVVGEGNVTLEITDPTTVSLSRAATSAAASFGWQVIEWAGPQWWDNGYTFRQRIDVSALSTAAPDDYTVPLALDHAALVANGLARADGDDVRILGWDGTAWFELDRVLDDGSAWNAADTTLWFRTAEPIAVASTISYWLYFGNPAPPAPAADPENVYLLTEGFESASLGDFEDRTGGTGWYSALPWSRRIPLTVVAAQVDVTLTDYPLLVSLTDVDLGANAQPDGADIRFTAANGVSPLAHEIEKWNPATGELVAWVHVPTVSAVSDTSLYLYYGAADAPSQSDVRATWSTAIEAAWHLQRDPSGAAPQVDDSSPNNHDGVSAGGMTGTDLVVGRAGMAVDLDGSDDRLLADPLELPAATELTVSGFVQLDSTAATGRILVKAANPADPVVDLAVTAGGAIELVLRLDGFPVSIASGPGVVGTGVWHHVAGTWDGTDVRLFLDGVEIATAPATGTLGTEPGALLVLGNTADGTSGLDGRLDETRVEALARPAGWLTSLVANLTDPGSFVVAGAPEGGSWFGQGSWSYRKPLAIPAGEVTGTLSDHSVLIDFSDSELAGKGRPDGFDVVFTAGDGITRLDHVVESFSDAGGSVTAWVSVPTLDATAATSLFMYYGNATAADQQDAAAVFGDDADLTAFFG